MTSADWKRRRSPSPVSDEVARLKSQAESFDLDKDASSPRSMPPATDTPPLQPEVHVLETTPPEPEPVNYTEPPLAWPAPSFHGNFDLYAMELPFLASEFTPSRSYPALLTALRTHQARGDSSAQIYLPPALSASPGRLRSLPLQDPVSGAPHKLALTQLAHHASVAFTARETTPDALYSAPPAPTPTAGVTAAVALAHAHGGVFLARGTFKMRRAWARADADGAGGADEVFEGFLSVRIVYTRAHRRRRANVRGVGSLRVRLPFWGIRARVGRDGREVGLATTGGDDDDLRMRELRLMLTRMAGVSR